ncbi:hypothetical protein BH09BAC6_BH09BAC6_26970 [soil metagenome]|jgi:hypothetical protein
MTDQIQEPGNSFTDTTNDQAATIYLKHKSNFLN